MKALIILPTYNESENLEEIVGRIFAETGSVNILVVDDNSPDGTGAIADELAKSNEGRLKVNHREKKLGLGSAYVMGFKHALDEGYEAVITMDADGSHDPAHLPAMLKGIEEYDVVIGSRYIPGGSVVNWGIGRKVLSRTANMVARAFLGLEVKDATSGFRCIRTSVVRELELINLKSDGYSILEELTCLFQRHNLKVLEIPITFYNRRRGSSKIDRSEIIKAMFTIVRLAFNRQLPRDRSE